MSNLTCGHNHPTTTGRCGHSAKAGTNCKINSVAWQTNSQWSEGTWVETCRRHMMTGETVSTTLFDECSSIFAAAFFAQLDAGTLPSDEAHQQLAEDDMRQLEDAGDDIDAWLDSRAGLNGTMTRQWGHTCAHCDGQMDAAGTGRPKVYCSTRCRVAAHRAAKR